ncbi:MAG TPA: peroxidase family protein, partial [Lapillicoccus sp.]|nr:peroxidase family protein [Lapillicoccus sp.]
MPNVPKPIKDIEPEVPSQPFLDKQLYGRSTPAKKPKKAAAKARPSRGAPPPFAKLPDEIQQSVEALPPDQKHSAHGSKYSLAYFPGTQVRRPCGDRFGYLTSGRTRANTRLPFTAANRALVEALGAAMAAPGHDTLPDSTIDAGQTYAGQFIDHDITLDVSSSLDINTDANTIHNMRTPVLDLDSVYGRGPALDPFLYDIPTSGNPSAIKMQLGTNLSSGRGGPGGPAGRPGMGMPTDRDVPRLLGPAHTAIIGDPRNDENLIVVQLHHVMLRFHNAVVDQLVRDGFSGDIFVEAKRVVTHHYQWAVVNDFLRTVCGANAVTSAMSSVSAPVNSPFRMPVEF